MILSQEHQVLLHPVLIVEQDSTLCHILDVSDRIISDRGSSMCSLQGLVERTLATTDIVPYLVGSCAIPATERDIVAIHTLHILVGILAHHSCFEAIP